MLEPAAVTAVRGGAEDPELGVPEKIVLNELLAANPVVLRADTETRYRAVMRRKWVAVGIEPQKRQCFWTPG